MEHIGIIEVLVLRCYPTSERITLADSPKCRTKPVQFRTVQERRPTPVPFSFGASNDDSSSDADGSLSTPEELTPGALSSGSSSDDDDSSFTLVGLSDGANDDIPYCLGRMHFGSDGSGDNWGQGWNNGEKIAWQQNDASQNWNDTPTNNTTQGNKRQANNGQWNNQVYFPQNVTTSALMNSCRLQKRPA